MMNVLQVYGPGAKLRGEVVVPGDKSISHRAVILGALAEGATTVSGFLTAEDCVKTARACQQMGVAIEGLGGTDLLIDGVGLRGLGPPDKPLDLGNSATGMRLLMGVVAGQDFTATLTGDESLQRRPMDRIAEPLGKMGVEVVGQGQRCTAPVTVFGGIPQPITYHSPVASAQVKSAVLLAGLNAPGTTMVIEPAKSRDHTERMLAAFGAQVDVQGLQVSVQGQPNLRGREMVVPGDFSSAAFFLVAGLLVPDSEVTVRGVLLNPTRTALIEILQRMGADIQVSNEREVSGEPMGDITACHTHLTATEVDGDEIPRMLDEVPILALAATQAEGRTVIRDAGELRVKESDRLGTTTEILSAFGAQIEQRPDGLIIDGSTSLHAATVDSHHDHRIAMTAAVAGLIAEDRTIVQESECIRTSFPDFVDCLRDIGADIYAE